MSTRTEFLVLLALVIAGIASLFLLSYQAAFGQPLPQTVSCRVQYVHDGDTFRCAGYAKSTRLYGVDAPEMPGACRIGRACTPGDPYASRDYLTRLIGNRPLQCRITDTDRYGRPVMRCSAGGVDLSCAMVKAGRAVERYGWVGC